MLAEPAELPVRRGHLTLMVWVPKTPSVQVKRVELACSREGMDTFKFTRSCRFKAPTRGMARSCGRRRPASVIDAVHPATVRFPDVVVVPTRVAERNPPRLDAADVLLAVEIISPGTRRTDRVTKLTEYADAGIAATGWSTWILRRPSRPTRSAARARRRA